MAQTQLETNKNSLREVYENYIRNDTFFLLTSPLRAFPDFEIVGAMKCGTASLYSYLGKHPQIFSPITKEIHYFDNNYSKSKYWYKSWFPSTRSLEKSNGITGEASPYYLFHPFVAERMHKLIPETKIIILLRNPVDRAISHYRHEVRRGQEKLPIKKAFERETERLKGEKALLSDKRYSSFNYQHFSYLNRGFYIDQIKEYRRHFNKEQILIIRSENMFENPQAVLDDIFEFLGVSAFQLASYEAQNTGSYKEKMKDEKEIREKLKKCYKSKNEELCEYLNLSAPWW